MIVLPDFWLDVAEKFPVIGGSAMNLRRILVIHATCGASGQSSIYGWRENADGICTHFVIERNGKILQCRPLNRSCGHVRDNCEWNGFTRLNRCSIGIELANAENDPAALSWARRQTGFFSVKARHKSGGPVQEWEGYPLAQLQAVLDLSKTLVARFNLDDVVAHEDLDPNRRQDPGPAFSMASLRHDCGFPTA